MSAKCSEHLPEPVQLLEHVVAVYGSSRSFQYPRRLCVREHHHRSCVCLLEPAGDYSHNALMYSRYIHHKYLVRKGSRLSELSVHSGCLKHICDMPGSGLRHALSLIVDSQQFPSPCLGDIWISLKQELKALFRIPQSSRRIDARPYQKSQIIR